MRSAFPNYTIYYWENIYVDGEKTFLEESTGGPSADMSQMTATFYHKDKAYVITCMAMSDKFKNYQSLFRNALSSIKLSK
jgi:hypothetical protein